MARRWENKEVQGRGTKYCLVIDPEDGTNPIRTYGWSVDEVLDKVAKTAETAQQVINRQRSAPPPAQEQARQTPAAPPVRPITADEQLQATADLTNPAKAPQAIRTLLRGVGIDVDKIKLNEDARRVAAVAQEWESHHPDFPSDERNSRLLLNTAAKNVGFSNISAQALDAAYSELLRFNMLFDVEPSDPPQPINPPAAPDGSPGTRVERPRGATSYRSSALRAAAPGASNSKPKYTRAEIDSLNSRQLRDKIEREPGFREWYDREFSAATA